MPEKAWWRKVHRALGLVVGLWLMWLGLTGSLLALGTRLDQWLHPHLFACGPGPAGPLQTALQAVQQRFPEKRCERLDFGRPLRFWLQDGTIVYVDPCDARVLGSLAKKETVRGFVLPLHELGEPVLPVVALLVAVMLLAGWILQKPDRRAWPARTAYDLHRGLGWLATPFLLAWLFTGAVLVEYKLVDRWLRTLSPAATPAVTPKTVPSGPDLDGLLAQALKLWPQAQPVRLQWGKKDIQVRLRQPGENNPVGRSFVHLDLHTGQVTEVEDALADPWSVRVLQGTYGIHAGYFPGGGLLVLLGLTPAVLWLSGMRLRQRRQRKKA